MIWTDYISFAAAGFAAQLVDGAIGMAYKVTTSALLLGLGIPPAVASATVHSASAITCAVSGWAHWRFGNVERGLLLRLAVPGVVGGMAGAVLLAGIPADLIRPVVSVYLVAMGGYIVWRALRAAPRTASTARTSGGPSPLGFVGGLCDAVGGGGWGPIVTTALVGSGVPARMAIGTTNAAEFFVTVAIAGALVTAIGGALWPIVAALVAGGAMAAPLAAYASKHLPERWLMLAVGILVAAISARTLILALA
ncbi:MAG: sulfite exporter TauE/SafE family protein [Hyphomicrobiaceae bacterium]|nr:sulfite exporter TauE/SafE family protein [Hyphomicrobiaceae bacterium]